MQLKVDPKRPHHYVIGVAVKSMRNNDPGKVYLKYGPVYYSNEDVAKVRDAKLLSEDRLFKTSSSDALSINECSQLVHSLTAMKHSASANDCTLHHFSSEHTLDDEVFKTLVETANFSKSSMKLLTDSRIRGF